MRRCFRFSRRRRRRGLLKRRNTDAGKRLAQIYAKLTKANGTMPFWHGWTNRQYTPPMASKFTEETRQLVLAALRENPSIYSAAARADIGYDTLVRWIQKGTEGAEGGYVEFLQEVEAARSMMKDEIVQEDSALLMYYDNALIRIEH